MSSRNDQILMRQALTLARKGFGTTSPNPMVGAVLVRGNKVLGKGWHLKAGEPHAEIHALNDAIRSGNSTKGATLYVTLEPCCTHGRTAPCTEALIRAELSRVVVGAQDPNPLHSGKGLKILRRAGLEVTSGVLETEAQELNEVFNHWIVQRTPFVTVKAGMTLDGKIATCTGESKWITSERSRNSAMQLRFAADAILVGVETILADDPSLTTRQGSKSRLRRIILDSRARTPLDSRVITDDSARLTTVVVTPAAPRTRVAKLEKYVRVLTTPQRGGRVHLSSLLRRLGKEDVTHLLVEGGGEVHHSFLLEKLANRIVFFLAPMILGGSKDRPAVAGIGATGWDNILKARDVQWSRVGRDLKVSARVD